MTHSKEQTVEHFKRLALRLSKLKQIELAESKEIIAQEQGARSWADLCRQTALQNDTSNQDDYLLYDNNLSNGRLNIWFATYAEAKAYQMSKKNSFLFPYKNTFFVCQASHLGDLNMDAHDVDWKKIGYDWVDPQDEAAKARLRLKLIKAWQEKNVPKNG